MTVHIRLPSPAGTTGASLYGVVGLLLAVSACGTTTATTTSSIPAPAAAWALRPDPKGGARDAGLPLASMAGMGAMAAHFHVHVDVFVNGTRVAVPAGVGIEPASGDMTDLHTHDSSGVVHVEAMGTRTYTLGQLFAEWGQGLDRSHLSDLPVDAAHPLILFVSGKPVSGDPAAFTLADHQEIAVVYGPETPTPVPSTFDFGKL